MEGGEPAARTGQSRRSPRPRGFRAALPRCLVVCGLFATSPMLAAVDAGDLGTRGGPEPANIDEITGVLRQDPYDLELLISFGTSRGGSAGHLALAIRDESLGDDLVHSANFHADRRRQHVTGFYTEDLMLAIPKKEYLFGTTSSLADSASFGLDFGEIYKRSVIGVRVFDVPAGERTAVAAYFRRINADYHRRARNTEYHDGEVRYDYMRLNCAKAIGAAFRFGAGYENLEVTSAKLLRRRRIVLAATANIPTEMAINLIREWDQRGYAMDVVLYRKYEGSSHVDPREEGDVAFKDLPNRFPSVLSDDFHREQGHYEDFDNLFAMHLLANMSRYTVRLNGATKLLEIETSKHPMPYTQAAELATRRARADVAQRSRAAPVLP